MRYLRSGIGGLLLFGFLWKGRIISERRSNGKARPNGLMLVPMLPRFTTMPLARRAEPFDHEDWLFELKLDGFRALAYVENGTCSLISRKRNTYKAFDPLCRALAETLKEHY
jgi:ATP-dependent DNA ligase